MDKTLNKRQLEAVKAVEGPVLVFAGAGTGKTKTLTKRIVHMVKDCNINPYNILAITFTKKATNEMRERLDAELGEVAFQIYISTIHSMCSRILRRDIDKLGYRRDFEIIDEEEGAKIINDILKKENIDKKLHSPKKALRIISSHKNNGTELYGIYDIIFEKYQQTLYENNMVDFDDLLLLTDDLFYSFPEVLERYQDLHQYILVDEFQDTNSIQYQIIKKLAQAHHNLFVVGDDDQSIYSFRGATSENMRLFMKHFPECKKVILEENYRSTDAILKGANSLISNNKVRETKNLFSKTKGDPSNVTVKVCYDYDAEVRYVLFEINKLLSEGFEPHEIAILYRNSALSFNFERGLIVNGIPHKIYGGFSYLKRREIKDIMSFLRFILDDTKVVHFRRIVNIPSRGIGDKTIEKIESILPDTNNSILKAIDIYTKDNPLGKNEKLILFREMITHLYEKLISNEYSLVEYFDYFLEQSGYLDYISQDDEEEEHRVDNVNEFKSILVRFEEDYKDLNISCADKLQTIFDEVLLDDSLTEAKQLDSIVLSTIHSAKGLEFRAVFVVGLEEGLFPLKKEDSDLEEERRIAYVGVTRAKERLYLTCSKKRLLYGRYSINVESRFLGEYLVHEDINKSNYERANPKGSICELQVNDIIHHEIYGRGKVVELTDKFVSCSFDTDGTVRTFIKNTPKIIRCEE